ncbi:MAG TPA: M48 family metalloprotease [Candidatus Aminicenantes bacterium]|nr:M48 family metalloprotease [Candidatus Aminicenantes bacterium]
MKRTSRVTWVVVSWVAVLLAVACAVNPVSGKKELMLFSEQQEIAMGQETDQAIRQQYGIYPDKELNEYVDRIGQGMVPNSHRPKLKHHFAVLDTPVVNAFAAPGGYIYVTRGILALMNSEAELAAVLGHEMGHVAARHSMAQMSGQMLAQIGLVVGSIVSKDIRKFAGLASIATQLLFLKFSRSDEYQADALGIRYARAAQYSPGEMLRFFSALENMSAESSSQRIPTFLSTHPMTKDRIAKVKEQVSSADVRLAVKRNDYLQRIDGMVYGDNPRQGFVETGVFYHPEMAFQFDVPNGWAVENTPMQVVVGEKEGRAALLLQAETSGQDLDAYLQAKAKGLEQAKLLRTAGEAVNGFTARHAWFQVPQQEGEPLAVRLSCIRKGGLVYSFVALSTYSTANSFHPVLGRSIESFRAVRDPKILNRGPERLSVMHPDGRQTFQTLLTHAGVDRSHWKQLSVFNSLSLDAVPEASTLVKMLR